MSNTKRTPKREHFNTLLTLSEVKANPALVEFINHELELLDRKSSADKRMTPTQMANEGVKGEILEGMEANRLYTITEIIKEIPACAEMTNQRVSALVRQLKDEGKIERIEEKRKAYFRLAH